MESLKGAILVVDDIPANLEILLDMLAELGHETLVATDGESALEQAAYAQPDLILLDVMMPGIDGFETCLRLKQNPATCGIPVIFMTALTDTADMVKGLEIGAVDYITKPLQHEEVTARVKTHLTLRQLQRGLEQTNVRLRSALAQIDGQIDEIAGLQRALLPDKMPALPGANLAVHWQSYDRAGGDYYDILENEDGSVGLLIADVSGHGPSAAVVVAMLHAWLHGLVLPRSPAQLLADLNERFTRREVGQSFITACFAWYHPVSRELVVASAGHPAPLLRRGNDVSRLMLNIAPPLAVFPGLQGSDSRHTLHPGDSLLFYTDGLSEATNPPGDFLDEEGLCAIFANLTGDASSQRDQLLAKIADFEAGARPSDDKALILLQVE